MASSDLNRHHELMVVTSEECGELTQVASKLARVYNTREELSPDWRNKLIEEAGDVYTMIELMVELGYFRWIDIQQRSVVKRQRLAEWTNLIEKDT